MTAPSNPAEVGDLTEEQFALTAAAQAFCNRGITIACPWEGDLDDEERERFDALVAAIAAYNQMIRRSASPSIGRVGAGTDLAAAFEHQVTQQTNGYEFKTGAKPGTWMFRCSDWIDITAILAALVSPPDNGGWMPIETAPKDGTMVDLWGTRNGTASRFTDAKWVEIHGWGTGDPTGEFRWSFPARDIYGEFEFTHWQPLPASPALQSHNEGSAGK